MNTLTTESLLAYLASFSHATDGLTLVADKLEPTIVGESHLEVKLANRLIVLDNPLLSTLALRSVYRDSKDMNATALANYADALSLGYTGAKHRQSVEKGGSAAKPAAGHVLTAREFARAQLVKLLDTLAAESLVEFDNYPIEDSPVESLELTLYSIKERVSYLAEPVFGLVATAEEAEKAEKARLAAFYSAGALLVTDLGSGKIRATFNVDKPIPELFSIGTAKADLSSLLVSNVGVSVNYLLEG